MDRPFEGEPLSNLRAMYDATTARMVQARYNLKQIADELGARFGDRFKAQLHNQGRDAGEETTLIDGYRVKMSVDKSVTWDQDMLRQLLVELPWDQAKEIITMKLSVGERTYARIVDDNLRGRLTGARTVAVKPPHIIFTD